MNANKMDQLITRVIVTNIIGSSLCVCVFFFVVTNITAKC